MTAAPLSPPTGLMPRFSRFIDGVRRAMAEGVGGRHDTLGPLAILLETYLSATLRRLAALHARFTAGKLAAAPRPSRPAAARPRAERRAPAIPPGPVLLTVFRAGFDEMFRALLDDPEMRALLAASPRAGRILRPLWRKLSPRPLPEALRLPPRPRRPRVKPPSGPPGLRPVASPNGFIQWEPTPCYPPFSPPPRLTAAPAARPAAPPPPARTREWGSPAPPAAPRPPLPHWLPLLFQR